MPDTMKRAAKVRRARARRYFRGEPLNRYIRPNGRRYQVRIPLDDSGILRYSIGPFDDLTEARFARSRLLAGMGVTIDAPPSVIYEAARAWLEREAA